MRPADGRITLIERTTGPRRPVPPASTRAYVPFVPADQARAAAVAVAEHDWPRTAGRVGIAASGMALVCVTVAAATGGHGPAATLVWPFIAFGTVAGGIALSASARDRFIGWRPGGAAVATALLALTFALTRQTIKPIAVAPEFAVAPVPSAGELPKASPAVIVARTPVTRPAGVGDEMIVARAQTLLAADPGFDASGGWVAVGRSGQAAIGFAGVDPSGPELADVRKALPVNVSMVVLSVDNTDGTKAVTIDPQFVRITTAAGAVITASTPRMVLSTATNRRAELMAAYASPVVVPPGAKRSRAIVFFPAGIDVMRLRGITFTVNGVTMTFKGRVMPRAEKAALGQIQVGKYGKLDPKL